MEAKNLRDRIIARLRSAQSELDAAALLLASVPRSHPLPAEIRLAGQRVEAVIDHVCQWDVTPQPAPR